MHRFFEEHPGMLMEATGRIPLSHRPQFVKPRGTPDYTFTPILGPADLGSATGLLELKDTRAKVLTHGLHAGFAAQVHRAVDQVRDYERSLNDPTNQKGVLRSLGYLPQTPKLAVLIGRTPKDRGALEVLQRRQSETNVRVVTYDEILEIQSSGNVRSIYD